MSQATFITPTVETQRLILRGPRMGDMPFWRAFLASDRAKFVGGTGTDDLAKSWRSFGHVAGMWALRGYGSFIITRKDDVETPLGMTGPWHPMEWPEPELGWTIWSPDAEGTGIAFEAATAARDFAFNTLGWKTAVSYIARDNHRSAALAERMGAVIDPNATQPDFDDGPVHIYRHPAPDNDGSQEAYA